MERGRDRPSHSLLGATEQSREVSGITQSGGLGAPGAAALILLAALSAGRVAAQSAPARADDGSAGRPEPIEEITVVGKESLRTLRIEVQTAREAVYDLFNSLNGNPEFDIHCRDAVRTGTRVARRVCRPQFADSSTASAALVFTRALQRECADPSSLDWEACFNSRLPLAAVETAAVPLKERQLTAEVQRLARENGEFRRAIAAYQAVERRYTDARGAEGAALRASVSIVDTARAPLATRRAAPQPVELVTPEAPSGPLAAGAAREGWVKLRYTVRADGTTADVRVVDAMPPGFDPVSTIAAARAWTFEPAIADGGPIDWHNNLAVVVFRGEGDANEGWLQFAEAYEAAAALLADARFADAKALNERTQRDLPLTIEEIALAQMQLAAIEHALGRPHAALAAIIRATEPAVPQLAEEELGLALEHRFALELELGRAAEALDTFERRAALARVSSRDPLGRRAAALRRALEAPDASLAVQARLDSSGRWEHALAWNTFAIGGVDGRNDGLEVECHRHRVERPFEADVEMTIPAAWGACAVLVSGLPDTTFTLYEFKGPIQR